MLQYKTVPVTPFQQNCSIVWCDTTKDAVVVDAGGEAEKLISKIEQLGLNIKAMLLTHGHLDHVSAAKQLSDHYSVDIIGPHKGDEFWLDGLGQQSKMFSFPHVESFKPHRWLEEGETYSFGECVFDVLHCPGHTPGHVILVDKTARKAFVGDVLFNGSIGRTDFPKGNHQELVDSIRDKLWPLGDDISFVPGHGSESTFGHERKTNPFVADKNYG